MATKTPYMQVKINLHGFNVLDVRFNVTGTENTKSLIVGLVSTVTGRDPADDNEWISDWYDHIVNLYVSQCSFASDSFYIGDHLISFHRYDVADNS